MGNIGTELKALEKKGSEVTLDHIFNTLDTLLLDKEFEWCDTFLKSIDPKDFEVNSLIGVLTVTSAWREQLSERDAFYQRVRAKVEAKYSKEEALQILKGLE